MLLVCSTLCFSATVFSRFQICWPLQSCCALCAQKDVCGPIPLGFMRKLAKFGLVVCHCASFCLPKASSHAGGCNKWPVVIANKGWWWKGWQHMSLFLDGTSFIFWQFQLPLLGQCPPRWSDPTLYVHWCAVNLHFADIVGDFPVACVYQTWKFLSNADLWSSALRALFFTNWRKSQLAVPPVVWTACWRSNTFLLACYVAPGTWSVPVEVCKLQLSVWNSTG
jgi:hypothetical protein